MSSTDTRRLTQQRQFYLLMTGAGLLLSLWHLLKDRPEMAGRLALFALFFVLIEFVVPPIGRAVFKAWMVIAHVLGKGNTFLLITIVFVGIITPIGLLRRTRAKADPNSQEKCSQRKSSWFALPDEHRYCAPF